MCRSKMGYRVRPSVTFMVPARFTVMSAAPRRLIGGQIAAAAVVSKTVRDAMPGHECPDCENPASAAEQQLLPGLDDDVTRRNSGRLRSSGRTTANIMLIHVSCALTPSRG